MLAQLINRQCQIVRRSQSSDLDDYGNEIPGEEIVETVCELQQRRRDEPGGEGETSDTEWVAFFLPEADLDTGDGLIVDGVVYEVTGDPWSARNPRTQAESHIEATLRRTAGSEEAS